MSRSRNALGIGRVVLGQRATIGNLTHFNRCPWLLIVIGTCRHVTSSQALWPELRSLVSRLWLVPRALRLHMTLHSVSVPRSSDEATLVSDTERERAVFDCGSCVRVLERAAAGIPDFCSPDLSYACCLDGESVDGGRKAIYCKCHRRCTIWRPQQVRRAAFECEIRMLAGLAINSSAGTALL